MENNKRPVTIQIVSRDGSTKELTLDLISGIYRCSPNLTRIELSEPPLSAFTTCSLPAVAKAFSRACDLSTSAPGDIPAAYIVPLEEPLLVDSHAEPPLTEREEDVFAHEFQASLRNAGSILGRKTVRLNDLQRVVTTVIKLNQLHPRRDECDEIKVQ
jgi:hypothetical protein